MANQMLKKIFVACVLVAVCAAQTPLPRMVNGTINTGGGEGLRDQPTQGQRSNNGKRGMNTDNEGCMLYTNEDTSEQLKFCLKKVEEIDAMGNVVCREGTFDFDPKNPATRNVTRQSQSGQEKNNADLNLKTKLIGARSGVTLSGTFTATGQSNSFQYGDMTCEIEAYVKDNSGTAELRFGSGNAQVNITMNQNDAKIIIMCSGHDFCGSPTKPCMCGGQNVTGERLKFYIQVQAGTNTAAPGTAASQKSGNVGTTRITHGNFDISVANSAIVDDGTNVDVHVHNISVGTMNDFGGIQVPVIIVSQQRINFNTVTKYIVDPTAESTNSGAAETMRISVAVLLIVSIWKVFC